MRCRGDKVILPPLYIQQVTENIIYTHLGIQCKNLDLETVYPQPRLIICVEKHKKRNSQKRMANNCEKQKQKKTLSQYSAWREGVEGKRRQNS